MAETVLDTFITEYLFKTDTRALDGLESRVDRVQRRLNSASTLFTVAGAALTGALFGAGRGILDFETEVSRLRRDTPATVEQLAAMRRQALELGSSADYTTISITDVVIAQRELIKSGLTVEQAMAAVAAVLDLVAATELDVAEAAGKSVKIMKGFGLTVADLPRINDLITFSAKTTGITAAQMVDTLLRVGPTARAAGIGLEDMVAQLSQLVDQGRISERAATSLERALVVMSKVEVLEPKARNALKELGIDIGKIQYLMAQGKIIEVFRELADANINVATASQVFGEDGQRAVLTLAQEIDKLEAFRGRLDDVADSTREAAGEMNKGLPGAVNALKSAAATAVVALGDAGLTRSLEDTAIAAREAVEWFIGADPELKKFVATALLAGPVFLGVGAGLRAASFALGGLVPAIRLSRRTLGYLRDSFVWTAAVSKATSLAIVGNWNLVSAQMVRTFRIGGIRGIFTVFFDWIKRRSAAAFAALGGSAVSAGVSIRGLLGIVSSGARAFGPWGLAISLVATAIMAAWKPVSTFFSGLWTALVEQSHLVGAAFGRLLDELGPVGDGIRWTFEKLGEGWAWLMSIFDVDLTAAGKSWGQLIIDSIVWVIDKVTEFVQWMKNLSWADVGEAILNGLTGGLYGAGKQLYDAVRSVFGDTEELMPQSDARTGPFSRLTESGRSIVETIATGIREADPLEMALKPVFGDLPQLGALAAPGVGALPASAGGDRVTVSRTYHVRLDRVEINVPSGDPERIAQGLESSLSQAMHNLVEDTDSDIDR